MNFHNITIYSPELLFKHTTKEKKEIDIKKIKASLKLWLSKISLLKKMIKSKCQAGILRKVKILTFKIDYRY